MGAAASSGHPSHPEHSARFKRVGGDNGNGSTTSRCRMCQLKVDVGAAAYCCSEPGCNVFLHEACYRRPKELKGHLAHKQHRLTLGVVAGDTARAGRLYCSICAKELGTPPVAYSCKESCSSGFHAHPRCCGLPPELQHEHRNLVLRPPPSSGGKGGDARLRRRRCLKCDTMGMMAATTTGRARAPAPWSYQCPNSDDVEYCLACVFGNDDDRPLRCCCFPCFADHADPAVVHCLGHSAGVFFCAFLAGMMGCPAGIPTQLHPAETRR